MAGSETRKTCLKFIKALKLKGTPFPEFEILLTMLQEEVTNRGLDNDMLKRLTDVIINTDLPAAKLTLLIKCLIPKYKVPEKVVKSMITWCLSSLNNLPLTVSTVIIQWVIEELGKYHQNVELPCNAVSLLANMVGYHLLTYADFQYQSRFSYNLYNTLIRAFILENEKFSDEEMDKFLTMTIEFSRYMQEGILIIKLFFDEYLYFNTGEHLLKFLDLLQWMTSISVTELQENILIHVENIFYESNLTIKCEIIKSLQKLITNLFVKQGLEQQSQYASSFLQQGPLEDLAEIIPVITTILENLIVRGLNIYNYNIILLSESLAFYEQICALESCSYVSSWTLPPPAVIYGAFITKSCAILSRVCKLLLKYRNMSPHLRPILPADVYQQKIGIISIYANDIHKALWYDKTFSDRKNGYLLKNLSKKVIDDLGDCDLDILLNICNHYAVLPYRYTINKTGLNINTKEDAKAMAFYYYPAVNKFLAVFTE
ncbi:hypothetical protein P5V15_010070 [Pogonomyrmex californicus]